MTWLRLTYIDTSQKHPQTKEPIITEYEKLFNMDSVKEIRPCANPTMSCLAHNDFSESYVRHSFEDLEEKVGLGKGEKKKVAQISDLTPASSLELPKEPKTAKVKGTTSESISQ